ncbi:hypothetical protein JHK82_035413 [Glycine max]|uniref:Uncharacterized protein n=1 Tax=Glycine soja TaxID=3848 RepID=A0A0B2PHF8_GLYSO|nr:hypothetical protein JHK87_035340 [Glycine soja]KAG4969713.1 hypothetical protein JHK85_036134 [Glycine max]KAG4976070.1 hypothetical protein JHK86_035544 [Glycine max]KAG5112144.1 hypothetical protein JHK82_035413 [Glycine max]KAG5129426.1 hypothetical protein JHK84_035823 [Glycine max]
MRLRSKEGLLPFAPFRSQDVQESLLIEQNKIRSTQNETRCRTVADEKPTSQQ